MYFFTGLVCHGSSLASCLFLVDLNDVVLLHLQSFRSLVVIDAATVKQEPSKFKELKYEGTKQNNFLT